ncbi:hypothetical protein GCM10009131_10730 [Morganella psychrotolerans]
MSDLFAHDEPLNIAPDACLFKGFLSDEDTVLLADITAITAISPFRHMVTPGGYPMSAAMSSCGAQGWISDAKGYRYTATDPLTGNPWPSMPDLFLSLAQNAAERAGFYGFTPDSCLINCYVPARECHCIRTEMNLIAASRLSRFRSGYLCNFSSAECSGTTR